MTRSGLLILLCSILFAIPEGAQAADALSSRFGRITLVPSRTTQAVAIDGKAARELTLGLRDWTLEEILPLAGEEVILLSRPPKQGTTCSGAYNIVTLASPAEGHGPIPIDDCGKPRIMLDAAHDRILFYLPLATNGWNVRIYANGELVRAQEQPTRFGPLRVIEKSSYGLEVRLGERLVLEDKTSSLYVHRLIALDRADVVLLSRWEGGNDCTTENWRILILSGHGSAASDPMGACSEPEIFREGETLRIRFPHFREDELWAVRDGLLRSLGTVKRQPTSAPLTDFSFLRWYEGHSASTLLAYEPFGDHLARRLGPNAVERMHEFISIDDGFDLVDQRYLVSTGAVAHEGGSTASFLAVDTGSGDVLFLDYDTEGPATITLVAGDPAKFSTNVNRRLHDWLEQGQKLGPGVMYVQNDFRAGLSSRYDYLEAVGAQRMLNYLGFSAGPVDGVWGPRSRAALRAFERTQGRAVGGSIDDNWSALTGAAAAAPAASPACQADPKLCPVFEWP